MAKTLAKVSNIFYLSDDKEIKGKGMEQWSLTPYCFLILYTRNTSAYWKAHKDKEPSLTSGRKTLRYKTVGSKSQDLHSRGLIPFYVPV